MIDPASFLAAQARADYLAGHPFAARQALEAAHQLDLEPAALLALCWVRQVLSDRPHGSSIDAAVLQAALATPFDDARLEADRQFALGWLHWLTGAADQAETLLAAAAAALTREAAGLAGEAAYWLARVRIGLARTDPVADYERTLRTLPASPQGTCWFVDLLWRTGQLDRADGVWKTVRGNRRVMACDEAPLLEARALLRRDETTAAERTLTDTQPRGGVVQVERLLLSAWLAAAHGQAERAADYLRQAEAGPYPPVALQAWQRIFGLRTAANPDWPETPGRLADWGAGQRARAAGRRDEAVRALRRAALGGPLQPFARYGLASLGEDDLAAVLASQPGWFLAQRCRTRLLLERFCRRDATPGELLEAVQQAEAAGYRPVGAVHYRRLALALKQRQPRADDLRRLAEAQAADGDLAARSALRAAAEAAVRLLPPPEAIPLLLRWVGAGRVQQDGALRPFVASHLLRLLLITPAATPNVEESLAAAESLLGSAALVGLLRAWLGMGPAQPPADTSPHGASAEELPPLEVLWRAAGELSMGVADPQRWREQVAAVRAHARFRGVAQCLLLREAAGRHDVGGVIALLDELDAWRSFSPGPPQLAIDALPALAAVAAGHPRWRASIARWLQLWGAEGLTAEARPLAVGAGLVRQDAARADPPPGLAAVPWLLHQAALALLREDAREALTWVKRAQGVDPDLIAVGEQAVLVRAARDEMQRLARAQLLADVVRLNPGQAHTAPCLLIDAVACLDRDPRGPAILEAVERGDLAAARQLLARLAARADLPPSLNHHLALFYHRAAVHLEACEQTAAAEPFWRLAWRGWLRLLALSPPAAGVHPLLAHLLAGHRRRITALLARNLIEPARVHWSVVADLAEAARTIDPNLAEMLTVAITRFREELATEYLVATGEAMRYGPVAAGWRADYETRLAGLVHFLALDASNVRLLTALVETCNDYFQDCYVNEDSRRLWDGVERYTPFAQQLALLADQKPVELTARAAVAEFYKFRGFVASERDRKLALFREALSFNPRNQNVRELLKQAEELKEAGQ